MKNFFIFFFQALLLPCLFSQNCACIFEISPIYDSTVVVSKKNIPNVDTSYWNIKLRNISNDTCVTPSVLRFGYESDMNNQVYVRVFNNSNQEVLWDFGDIGYIDFSDGTKIIKPEDSILYHFPLYIFRYLPLGKYYYRFYFRKRIAFDSYIISRSQLIPIKVID